MEVGASDWLLLSLWKFPLPSPLPSGQMRPWIPSFSLTLSADIWDWPGTWRSFAFALLASPSLPVVYS